MARVDLFLEVIEFALFTLAAWGSFAHVSEGLYAATPRPVRKLVCREPLFRRLSISEWATTRMVARGLLWSACALTAALGVLVSTHALG